MPVQVPSETVRVEECGLFDPRTFRVGKDLELQPRSPGEFHFGPQAQKMGRLERFNPPEVQWLADTELARVAAAPSHAHAAEYAVDEASELP